MTTLVTVTTPTQSVMVSDQGITSDLMHQDQRKIYVQDSWLIGVTGTLRLGNLLWYATQYPEPPSALLNQTANEWFGWIVTTIIPEIRYTLEQHMPKEEREGLAGGELLLTTHGRSYHIAHDLAVTTAEPYWSAGSGAHLAIGALTANQYNKDWHTNPATYAKEAVQIASQHDPYTRGAITGYTSHRNGTITEA